MIADSPTLGFKMQRVMETLRRARTMRATDVLAKVGHPVCYVIDTRPTAQDTCFERHEIDAIFDEWLSESERELVRAGHDVFVLAEHESFGRTRLTASMDERGPCAEFRLQAAKVPNIDALRNTSFLDQAVADLYKETHGLVLIVGPPGSGKTTIAHGWIDAMNRLLLRHIITAEWPPEYVHQPARSWISQRNIGHSTVSALSTAMGARRRRVDTVYIAELFDLDSHRGALRAAASGLTLATGHSLSVPFAAQGFIEQFPVDEQPQIRVWLAQHLRAIVGVRLLPRADAPGMVFATELLRNTPSVTNHILKSDYSQIAGAIQIGKKDGMHTMDDSLARLVAGKHVRPEDAMQWVSRPEQFNQNLSQYGSARTGNAR